MSEESCTRVPHLRLFNTSTGESYKIPCNTYSCPVCGPRKARKLRKALEKLLLSWSHIRLWTFTLTNRCFKDKYEHYKALSECWRRFTIEMRRSKFLSDVQKNFQYVKVCDFHKSGFVHFHCFVDCFLAFHFVNTLWDNICKSFLLETKHTASAHVKLKMSAKNASYYVVKYVLKVAQSSIIFFRRWSKSGRVSIFEKKKKNLDWICLDMRYELSLQFDSFPDVCYSTRNTITPNFTDFIQKTTRAGPICKDNNNIITHNLFLNDVLSVNVIKSELIKSESSIEFKREMKDYVYNKELSENELKQEGIIKVNVIELKDNNF